MNIAYAGFDFFSSCLSSILHAGITVKQVYSVPCDNRYNYNNYIHEICRQNDLPLSLMPIDSKSIDQLAQNDTDVLITAAYPHKIPDLSGTSIKGINIHPSLLPVGRGRWPLPHTILKAVPQTGVSIHKLTNKFDAGDILLQAPFPLDQQENLESLSCKLQIHAEHLVHRLFGDFESHWKSASPQSAPGEYWALPTDAERSLDWTQSVARIERVVRAFGKFESYAHFEEQDWLVTDASVWKEKHNYRPGSVVHKSNTEVVVAAIDGLVCLRYFYERPAT